MSPLDYGRLGKSGPTRSQNPDPKKCNLKIWLFVLTGVILVVCGIATGIALATKKGHGAGDKDMDNRHPSQAMSQACNRTRYPSVCVDSLLNFPGAASASEMELVNMLINVTLQNVAQAVEFSNELVRVVENDPLFRSAYDNCMELMDHSVHLLTKSLKPGGSYEDKLTWLSAALTNQDTCDESLEEAKTGSGGEAWTKLSERMSNLTMFVRNSLNMYAAAHRQGPSVSPAAQAPSRRLLSHHQPADFPAWLTRQDRFLLNTPTPENNADVVVSSAPFPGSVKTISEAIKLAPAHSQKRFIIYVKAGRYEESKLVVGKDKTKITLIGEGQNKTIITGAKTAQHMRTFDTASFAAVGDDFMARDITFENTAGAGNHQAVALRVGSDRSVFIRCTMLGYQDTLYARNLRQFYRDCDIRGTVDFIFGNGAVVLQNCDIYARKPMAGQSITITASGRTDSDQLTGILIHGSRVLAEQDFDPAAVKTYLGRPWKAYSRTVFMQTMLGGHVNPAGWLAWDGDFGLDTLYYGEYMNNGPGAGVGLRVKWPGYHVITSVKEAGRYMVDKFILGSTWLPAGVPYDGGLSN